ncbi:MAG: hypothetical protein NVS3B1_07930 [Marmoricola sp.]
MPDEIFAYVKELGDRIYIQSPVSIYEPDDAERETFAFKDQVAGLAGLKAVATNPKILWAQGRYVEADNPNGNNDMWMAGELAIKSLTPNLMPITVMHDLRSAVGVIAHTALKLPGDEGESVPRPRLENVLAIWAHRFPDVAEETRVNASNGTLMQSMECISPHYDCSVCGEMIQRTPDWQAEWRAHCSGHQIAASGDLRAPARILRSVVFTGTGLIFGTRGAKGAYSEAHVEVEALAELHAKSHRDRAPAHKPKRRQNFMDIEDSKYEALVAKAAQVDEAERKATEATAKLSEKDQAIEQLEADKVKAEQALVDERKLREEAEEKANVAAMRDDRLGKLGAGFVAALDKRTNTKAKVQEQAGTLSDEDWASRVSELEELLDVKADAAATEGGNEDDTAGLFSREVVASAGVAPTASAPTSTEVSTAARQSVIGGLVRRQTRPTIPAGK